MHPDGSHHGIAFGIDDADIARPCVDYIDFVLLGVGCDSSGFDADFYSFRRLKCTQVNDGDCVALAVSDVSVFAIGRAVIGQRLLTEVPPSQGGGQWNQHHEEEEFSQISFRKISEQPAMQRV